MRPCCCQGHRPASSPRPISRKFFYYLALTFHWHFTVFHWPFTGLPLAVHCLSLALHCHFQRPLRGRRVGGCRGSHRTLATSRRWPCHCLPLLSSALSLPAFPRPFTAVPLPSLTFQRPVAAFPRPSTALLLPTHRHLHRLHPPPTAPQVAFLEAAHPAGGDRFRVYFGGADTVVGAALIQFEKVPGVACSS